VNAITEWDHVLATLTPEQLRLYRAAEAEWQNELDRYIRDYEQAWRDYLRDQAPASGRRKPQPFHRAYPGTRPAAPRSARRKSGARC
jgi:hypothetical protein